MVVRMNESSALFRFGEVISLLRGELVAQANRMVLANVGFWPSRKAGKGKLPRRAAKQLSIVKRLRKARECNS